MACSIMPIALAPMLLVLGCVSTNEHREMQKQLVDTVHVSELRQERIERYVSERDAARADAERERALRRDLETTFDRQAAEFKSLTSRQDEEYRKIIQERDALKARLRDAELQTILECQEQVRSCRAMASQKEESFQRDVATCQTMVEQREQDCQQQVASCQQLVRSRATGCRDLVAQAEKKAEYKGMLSVWENLSISASPSVDGILFKDYFLTVNVSVKGHSVYSFRVQTAKGEPGFLEALSTAADVATIAKFVK